MWRNKILLVIGFVLITQILQAQPDLSIQGTAPRFYLVHTVEAKETWYSIGRLYNISPRDIASFNNTTMDNTLLIAQQLKVPLTDANFSQDGTRQADEVFVPLTHTVQPKEWMYRIGLQYKVPVETLETWNGIKGDQLQSGTALTVGYLKVKSNLSALAYKGSKRIVAAVSQPIASNDAPAPAPVTRVEEPRKKDPPVTTTTAPEPEREEIVTTPPPPVRTTPVQNTSNANVNYRGGYFRSMYNDKGKHATGNSGIFRSTSGWKDGKYYALMNDVPVGTIIKVTFSSTNKSIYAKVLGQLPDMKESIGLTLRISDAAAAEIGAELNKFYVDVKY